MQSLLPDALAGRLSEPDTKGRQSRAASQEHSTSREGSREPDGRPAGNGPSGEVADHREDKEEAPASLRHMGRNRTEVDKLDRLAPSLPLKCQTLGIVSG